jgi:hypothetical protein
LKGGTAINLFVRDMPRMSVDIDLTYLPFDARDVALAAISEGLHRIKARVDRAIPSISTRVVPQGGDQEAKLTCQFQQAIVKVEVNTVMRGHLWPTRRMVAAQSAQDEFGHFAEIEVVSHAELFGGKICAALDRQHPRDLFDVQELLDLDGLTDDLRLGFVASLLCHTRPMHELLRPQFQDRRAMFNNQFAGMTLKPYSYEEFEATRERLVREIHLLLTDDDRELLLSLKRGEPDWNLFPVPGLQKLPAVQWKFANIQQLAKNVSKHADQLKALEDALTAP